MISKSPFSGLASLDWASSDWASSVLESSVAFELSSFVVASDDESSLLSSFVVSSDLLSSAESSFVVLSSFDVLSPFEVLCDLLLSAVSSFDELSFDLSSSFTCSEDWLSEPLLSDFWDDFWDWSLFFAFSSCAVSLLVFSFWSSPFLSSSLSFWLLSSEDSGLISSCLVSVSYTHLTLPTKA